MGQDDRARGCYDRALALDPLSVEALNNLAGIHRSEGRFEQAASLLRQVTDLQPTMPEAHHNLGTTLSQMGEPEGAMAAFKRSFDLGGDWLDPVRVAKLLVAFGRSDDAEALLTEYLERHPEDEPARFQLAAVRGDAEPRASDAYVRTHFDGFADSFDSVLGRLGYRAPELVVEAVKSVHPNPGGSLAVADLGCGTGLCGPLLRPWARTLVGIDLSPRMIHHAKGRGYDHLEVAELHEWLEGQAPDAFDLLICVDTLVYVGALGPAFAGCRHALREGGHLVTTLERSEGEPVVLDGSGRYQHTPCHVEEAASEAGLSIISMERAVLRKESGRDVEGMVITVRA